MYRLKFKIETLSPVVIAAASNSTIMTGSHSEIRGSIIRGILAARYVQEKNLGNKAHADKNFQELFYGGLKFLSANPEINGARSFILPLSLQRGKKGTGNENNIADLLKDTPPAGYKSLRGYGIVDGEKIFTASINKNIFMHMSRSEGKERISGKSEEGHIYNYEALEEGQIFCGEILGEKSLIDKLELENKTFETRLGRSKFTQYGKCRFSFGAVEEIKAVNLGEKIYLRLESPLIAIEDNFISAENILQAAVLDKLEKNFKLGKIFASGIEIENFVVPWGMKRPRVMALAAGTVFELEILKSLTDADKNNLCEKMYSGFGTRTEEGFGQLRFWQPENFILAKLKPKIIRPENFSDETLEIARKILLNKYLEQLRIYAHEDAEKLNSQLRGGNFTHFFSRLDNLLSTVGKENVRQNFSKQVNTESKDGNIFQDNLKKIYLEEQTLYNILTGAAKLPYENKTISLGDENLFKKINFKFTDFADEFCYEYLQNFLRFARKNAAMKGGGKND